MSRPHLHGNAYAQVYTTTPAGTYGAGEVINLYVGFRFPVLVESDTASLYINTEAGGESAKGQII